MVELLSPVGDFECLKAAVQNGADAVYFGANMFSARASATNFDLNNLESAINYAKLRGVKTNLTLNTLIKNNELNSAFELAKKAYEFGIDAIIVQDLGLASLLIKNFPDLPIHASTQMSTHNLEGVKKLEKIGFKRVVLSRELTANDIEYICKNCNIEIECFVHGALCISYSGQCLFSSMVGGRSGNRGRCAQPCRLPYTLLENETEIDKGYLLSPRDLCGLEYLPQLIKAGVNSFKIEGRMKTPEYVATVTRIYRKYIDIELNDLSSNKLNIDNKDKHDLMQVFNRGGFSDGHFSNEENKNLIFKEKPNNMGIFLGTVSNFNPNKGYVTLNLKDDISIGDKICISTYKEDATYTISELMLKDKNIPIVSKNNTVKIGRMKGNIKIGDKIYKLSSKQLTDECKLTFSSQELKKNKLTCNISVIANKPVIMSVSDNSGININIESDIIPVPALSSPITEERIIAQLSKTNNTPYSFSKINVTLGENLYIPSISKLNELRRQALQKYENNYLAKSKKVSDVKYIPSEYTCKTCQNKKISLLLNIFNKDFNYSNLPNTVDRIYIPLKYFFNKTLEKQLLDLSKKFSLYIYMPCIMRNNYIKLFNLNIDNILTNINIKGFVVSNMGQFELLEKYKNYNLISNYTLNVYNNVTANNLNVSTVTLSPELSKDDLTNLGASNKFSEILVYGKTPIMNSNYCLLGSSNKCYKECSKKCLHLDSNKYYLKDRLGFPFRIIPDNIDTVTTIYNSKTTSISQDDLNCDYIRIDILDENMSEINNIITTISSGNRFEGKQFTNGNFNKGI